MVKNEIMKTRSIQFAVILTVVLFSTTLIARSQPDTNKKTTKQGEVIQLFNGKDLSNWTFFLKDATVDPAKVFTVQNGVIHITGDPFGYMRTKESYSDYKLHVEWRWPSEATNSGVFVHGQQPDAIWLKCIECQLKAGSAGDFVLMNGADINERADKTKMSYPKMGSSSEKPTGEWNTMEVVCNGNTVEVYVNGVMQNRGTGSNINAGSVCLQSEGKAIEFRNVFLTRLK